MAIILGGLALILGITAIWLATTSMKKIDSHRDLLLQRIRSEQLKSMDELKSKVDVVEKESERLSDQLNSLGSREDS